MTTLNHRYSSKHNWSVTHWEFATSRGRVPNQDLVVAAGQAVAKPEQAYRAWWAHSISDGDSPEKGQGTESKVRPDPRGGEVMLQAIPKLQSSDSPEQEATGN